MSETIIPFTLESGAAALYDASEYHDFPKAHADDAAYDLRSAEDVFDFFPGKRRLVKTGVRLAIPEGFAGLVLPRSGLALKYGVTVLNAPGLIDPGYRGEIGVVLIHHGEQPIDFERGDRIAQLLIIGVGDFVFKYWPETAWNRHFGDTRRGEGGFGSTGR